MAQQSEEAQPDQNHRNTALSTRTVRACWLKHISSAISTVYFNVVCVFALDVLIVFSPSLFSFCSNLGTWHFNSGSMLSHTSGIPLIILSKALNKAGHTVLPVMPQRQHTRKLHAARVALSRWLTRILISAHTVLRICLGDTSAYLVSSPLVVSWGPSALRLVYNA